jgi:hypothetical protein
MRTPVKVAVAVVALVALGGAGFAGFEVFERSELAGKASKDCTFEDKTTVTALPLGLPLTDGEEIIDIASQGRTTVAFASAPGGRDDIVEVRDKVLADLKAAGYTVDGTDQEPGYEAEAQISGPHEGTLKVSPLCTGLLEVRYKLES